jgi:type I restriction enzyme, S subunit
VFGSGGIMRYANTFLYNKESVLIPRKGTLNNVMYQDEPFWTVDTMFYTEMKVNNVAKYVFQFLKQQDLASLNVGSAVPSMTTEILNNMAIDIPDSLILERFDLTVSEYYKKIKSNQIQIRTLTSMRDNLLPKLMSGEVRVKL